MRIALAPEGGEIVRRVDIEGDSRASVHGDALAGLRERRVVKGEASDGSEARRESAGGVEMKSERVRPLVARVGGEDAQGAAQEAHDGVDIGGGEEGKVGHEDDGLRNSARAEVVEGAVDDVGEAPLAATGPRENKGAVLARHRRDLVALGRDDDTLDGARRSDHGENVF